MEYQDKVEIRNKVLKELTQLPLEVRAAAEDSLIHQFKELVETHNYTKIGMYYGKFPELTTEKFFKAFPNLSFYLPRIMPERQLAFHRYQVGDPLETNWGIYQPTKDAELLAVDDLDLLVCPGVAFDPEGYRVGFGGGYYDRLLSKTNTPSVSLIFQEQSFAERIWELNQYDIAVGQVIVDERGELIEK